MQNPPGPFDGQRPTPREQDADLKGLGVAGLRELILHLRARERLQQRYIDDLRGVAERALSSGNISPRTRERENEILQGASLQAGLRAEEERERLERTLEDTRSALREAQQDNDTLRALVSGLRNQLAGHLSLSGEYATNSYANGSDAFNASEPLTTPPLRNGAPEHDGNLNELVTEENMLKVLSTQAPPSRPDPFAESPGRPPHQPRRLNYIAFGDLLAGGGGRGGGNPEGKRERPVTPRVLQSKVRWTDGRRAESEGPPSTGSGTGPGAGVTVTAAGMLWLPELEAQGLRRTPRGAYTPLVPVKTTKLSGAEGAGGVTHVVKADRARGEGGGWAWDWLAEDEAAPVPEGERSLAVSLMTTPRPIVDNPVSTL